MLRIKHKSDCAVYNEPALPYEPCNCGAEEQLLSDIRRVLRRGEILENNVVNSDLRVALALLKNAVIEVEN